MSGVGDAVRAGTGPFIVANEAEVRLNSPQSEMRARPDAETVLRFDRMRQWNRETAERQALLGLVMAQLIDVPLEDKALVLDVKAPRLIKFLHGEASIPGRFTERWEVIYEAFANLGRVIKPSAFGRWLRTPVPARANQTPLQIVAGKDGATRLKELTATYLLQSFS